MIDLRKLRDNENYREGIIRKGVDPKVLDELLAIEATCRDLQSQVEKLRSEQNTASKDIGMAAPGERDDKLSTR